jgi:hypothetical protein
MLEVVKSVNGITIRLTDERWVHITEEHCEMAGLRSEILATVAKPLRIFEGGNGELLAISELQPGRCLIVVYKELESDGFVITAFLTSRIQTIAKRRQL